MGLSPGSPFVGFRTDKPSDLAGRRAALRPASVISAALPKAEVISSTGGNIDRLRGQPQHDCSFGEPQHFSCCSSQRSRGLQLAGRRERVTVMRLASTAMASALYSLMAAQTIADFKRQLRI